MTSPDAARPNWPLERLAAVADETPERLAWYAAAGMLHLDAPDVYAADSLHRLRLIRHAHRRGISDEDLALAIKEQGDLLNVFEEIGGDTLTDQTLRQAAGTMPTRLLDELLALLSVDPDELASTEDVEAVELLNEALRLGLPEDALIQLIRVYIDSTGRIADAEVRIFHDHVHEQFRVQGLTGKDLLAATEAVGKPALSLAEPALLYFHRRSYSKASRDDLLRHLAEATTPPSARPGETTGTVMFVDLAGFTPLTVALGDSGVADILQRFASTIRAEADTHAGRIIKQIGDAFMLVFDRPADAVNFGLDVLQRCSDDADLPPLHIGAHHGPLLYQDGDYYGNTVNLAARVTSSTEAGQFLITDALADAAGSVVDASYAAVPPRQLKGVDQPVQLRAVQPRGANPAAVRVEHTS